VAASPINANPVAERLAEFIYSVEGELDEESPLRDDFPEFEHHGDAAWLVRRGEQAVVVIDGCTYLMSLSEVR
jgi:hypothetical protein